MKCASPGPVGNLRPSVHYSVVMHIFRGFFFIQGYNGGGRRGEPAENQERHRSGESCNGAHRAHNVSRRVR